MRDKILAHVGSLLGGLVHNLNTPLMWVMGRSQLLQARNDRLEMLRDMPDDEFNVIKEKNIKDISSIQEGADKIDHMLKAIGYKIQMVNEGFTSLELKEYINREVDFLMSDMRFKHETKLDVSLDDRSYYVKVDYNSLSYAITGIINIILGSTEKNRSLNIALHNGLIRISCPQINLTDELRDEIDSACKPLEEAAGIYIDTANGFEVSIGLKDL